MKRILPILVCLMAPALFPAMQSHAGWMIEEVRGSQGGGPGGSGEQDRQVMTMSSNRMKTVILDRAGKPTTAWIMDLEAQTITTVDYEQRAVATGTAQEYVETIQGAMQAMAGQMAGSMGQMQEAMKQMQEALKDMPPEQRKMMEQMMQQSAPGGARPAAPSTEACREPKVEVRPTGQTARVAGFQATRFDILEDGKFTEELWISKAITAWQEIDPKKLERLFQQMAKAMESLPGCGRDRARRGGADPHDPVWKLMSEGYPVRTVYHGQGGGAVTEVVKAESRGVPLAEFQPPAGFKRQTFKEMMRSGQ